MTTEPQTAAPLSAEDHFPFLGWDKKTGLPYLQCNCGWTDLGDTGWSDHLTTGFPLDEEWLERRCRNCPNLPVIRSIQRQLAFLADAEARRQRDALDD